MPLPAPAPSSKGEQEWDRIKAILDGWLEECASIQERVIEELLANLPSALSGE